MKISALAYASAAFALALPMSAEVIESTTITPSDLGAHKFIVGATAKTGQLVILRMLVTTYRGNESSRQILDQVHYRPGKRCEGSVFAINPDFFKPREDRRETWHLMAFGGSNSVSGKWSGTFHDGDSVTLKFKGEGALYDYRFSSIVMKYEEAAKLYDDLPKLPSDENGGWVWGGEPKI